MTILRETENPEDYYVRGNLIVASQPVLADYQDGTDSLYEFCIWCFNPDLFRCIGTVNCVISQTAFMGGGTVLGLYFPCWVRLNVKGDQAWEEITLAFDEEVLGPVWGEALEQAFHSQDKETR